MKRLMVVTLVGVLLAGSLLSVGCAAKLEENPTVEWTFQSGQVSSNIYFMQEFEDCVKRIADRTNGKFNISIVYAGALGIATPDFPYAVGRGDIELTVCGSGEMEGIWPGQHAFSLPFFIRNQNDALKVWEATQSIFLKPWNELGFQLPTSDSVFAFGPQELITAKAIPNMKDLDGFRIRVWRTGDAELIKALGGEPIQMSFSEVYMALQRGAVDGVVTSAAAMIETSLYEVGKNFYGVGLAPGCSWAFVNTKAYNALPDSYKTVLAEEFDASFETIRGLYTVSIDESWDKLRSLGVTVNELPSDVVDTWIAAAIPNWETWGMEKPGNQEVLDAARKALGR